MAMEEIIMNTQDIIIKYALGIPARFKRLQKDFFVNEMGKDFQAAGYKVKAVKGKHKRTEGINLVVGDLDKARYLIVANYDTPSHNFGNPMKYYPYNGAATYASSFLPSYAPVLIGLAFALYVLFMQVPHFDMVNNKLMTIFWSAVLFAALILPAFMIGSVANKMNFNRNTSGCIAALKTAELLSNEQKKHVAFVLTDHGCLKHTGDYILRNSIPDTIDNKTVIMLDCVGDKEGKWAIGFKKISQSMADQMAACLKTDAEKVHCKKVDLRYTSFSFYPKSILISRPVKHGDSFIINNTATNKDIACDPAIIDELAEALVSFCK